MKTAYIREPNGNVKMISDLRFGTRTFRTENNYVVELCAGGWRAVNGPHNGKLKCDNLSRLKEVLSKGGWS